jgi:hypothetical protein
VAVYDLVFGGAAATLIASGTAIKTLCQVALATTSPRAKLIEWSVSFDGTNASAAPVLIQLNRQTTAGTGGVANTMAPRDTSEGATAANAGFTALNGILAAPWTAEPTAGTIIYNERYTPVGLGPAWQYPPGREFIIPNNTRLAIVITSAVTVGCSGHMAIEI